MTLDQKLVIGFGGVDSNKAEAGTVGEAAGVRAGSPLQRTQLLCKRYYTYISASIMLFISLVSFIFCYLCFIRLVDLI